MYAGADACTATGARQKAQEKRSGNELKGGYNLSIKIWNPMISGFLVG